MEQLKKPIWLLISFIVPLVLLLFLFYETYQIIESLLTEEQHSMWFNFAMYFICLIALCGSYIVYMVYTRSKVDPFIAWFVILLNILNITLYFFFIEKVLPRTIPGWMFTSNDLYIYPYSFLIPGVLYGMIILVMQNTPDPKTLNPYKNLIPVFGIPIITIGLSYLVNFVFQIKSSNSFFLNTPPFLYWCLLPVSSFTSSFALYISSPLKIKAEIFFFNFLKSFSPSLSQ